MVDPSSVGCRPLLLHLKDRGDFPASGQFPGRLLSAQPKDLELH